MLEVEFDDDALLLVGRGFIDDLALRTSEERGAPELDALRLTTGIWLVTNSVDGKDGQTVGNGIKTVGIVGTVVGAALVGTGIWLVSSDGGSSYRRGGYSRSRYRRFADSMPATESVSPDWGLKLNVGPASGGLTLVF